MSVYRINNAGADFYAEQLQREADAAALPFPHPGPDTEPAAERGDFARCLVLGGSVGFAVGFLLALAIAAFLLTVGVRP